MLFNPQVLAKLIHEAPERNELTIKRTAERMGGVSPKYLSRQINPDDRDAKLGVEDFVYFLEVTDLEPLDYIEQAFGRIGISIPDGKIDLRDLADGLAKTSTEFAEMLTEMSKSLADGVLDTDEQKNCCKETYDLLLATAALWMKLQQRA